MAPDTGDERKEAANESAVRERRRVTRSDAMGDLVFSVPILQLTMLLVVTVGLAARNRWAGSVRDADQAGGCTADDELTAQ